MYVIRPTWPSGVSTPSYSRCAIDIVRFGLKLSLRLASCCSVEVVNGGAGLRFCVLVAIDVTRGRRPGAPSAWSLRGRPVADLDRLAVDPDELGLERLAGLRGQERAEGPVLPRDEGVDLALALDHQADGHGLDATGRQAAPDLAREQRAERVADESVDDPARLLGVDEVRVDRPRVGEGLADRALGDLGEGHAARLARRHVRGLGDVPGDRLALAVEVGGEVDRVRALRRLLDVGDLLAPILGDDVLGREAVVDVDAELALAGVIGQVADVPVGSQDTVIVAEVALDRPCLGGRLDDHEVLRHRGGVYARDPFRADHRPIARVLRGRLIGPTPRERGAGSPRRSRGPRPPPAASVTARLEGIAFLAFAKDLDEPHRRHREHERRVRVVDEHRLLAVDRMRRFVHTMAMSLGFGSSRSSTDERLVVHQVEDGPDHGGTIAAAAGRADPALVLPAGLRRPRGSAAASGPAGSYRPCPARTSPSASSRVTAPSTAPTLRRVTATTSSIDHRAVDQRLGNRALGVASTAAAPPPPMAARTRRADDDAAGLCRRRAPAAPGRPATEPEVVEELRDARDDARQVRPIAQEAVAARGGRGVDRARHDEALPPLLERP